MEPVSREWPSARWGLTAPESYVLQLPEPLSSVEAFKLALRELALRRALQVERLERKGPLARRRPKVVLRAGTNYLTEPALMPLLELHGRLTGRRGVDGVLVEDFAKAARREFSRSLAGYVDDCVYPSLVQRGLMRPEEVGRLRMLRRRQYALTPAGREAAGELDAWLRVGRDRLEAWARDEPQRALAYAGGAGAAILLMKELYPEFDRLGKRIVTGAEHGSLDFETFGVADAGDGGAFDAFDSFDGIDAGVDVGAGWGGDGGGGNGGGGNGGGG